MGQRQEPAQPVSLNLVELAPRVLPVLAVLLPVAGIVTRFVALSFDAVPVVAILAVEPGLLIATAVLDLVDVLIVLLIAFAIARALTDEDGRLAVVTTRLSTAARRARIALLIAMVVIACSVLIFVVRYSTIPMTLAALLLLTYWQLRARQWGTLSFSRIWPSTACSSSSRPPWEGCRV